VLFSCMITALVILVVIAMQGNLGLIMEITPRQLLLCSVLGLLPMGFSFVWWNYGITKGDVRLLSIISYIIPILGSIWLMLFGIERFSASLLLAFILIAIGTGAVLFWKETHQDS